jgi:hypothetical protein
MKNLSKETSKAILYAAMDSLADLSNANAEKLVKVIHKALCDFVIQKQRLPNQDQLRDMLSNSLDSQLLEIRINKAMLIKKMNQNLSRIQIFFKEDTSAASMQTIIVKRLFLEDIDTFSNAVKISPQFAAKKSLDNVYEDDVKDALIEIIGERFTPKHSATEKSDIYTCQISLEGQRVPAAFLLKSMRSVKVLDMKELGKRGNQVIRLVKEPAVLFVVQHTGEIATDVIEHLDAQLFRKAKGLGTTLYYNIMDGNETARILIGYGKIK